MQVIHSLNKINSFQSPSASAIIKALVYFNIFNYPLTKPEIEKFSAYKFFHLSELDTALNELEDKLIIHRFGEFYSLQNDYALITRRQAGNLEALKIMDKATNRARLIQKFPFVRSVNISGSLSKNYFDSTTDVDYFVITKANRLWLTRLLLTGYKKIFLLNSRKYFCINYYVDEQSLEIPDKNIFSATEILTLKNLTGKSYYQQFLAVNAWAYNYFPNFKQQEATTQTVGVKGGKKWLEYLLNGSFGNFIESNALRLTQFFISKKYKHLSKEEFNVNLRTNKHASKHHPQGFQFRVLNEFDQQCINLESLHNISLL